MSSFFSRRFGASSPSSRVRVLAAVALVALAAACSPPSFQRSADTNGVVNVPGSIDASGNTDVTAALQQFLSRTPNGSTIVFPAGARYRVEGTLHLHDRTNLTIEGSGATMFVTTAGDRERSQWAIRRSSNIVFRGLTIVGPHTKAGTGDEAWVVEREAQHAFQLEGVRNVELDSLKASNVYGDFVYITRDLNTKAWSDGVWVHDNTFTRNGRMGVAITAGRNIVIERNDISEIRRSTINFEPSSSSGGAEYVRIDNNRIGPGRLNFVSAGKSLSTRTNDVHDIVISNNVLDGHLLNVFVATRESYGQRRANFSVINNRSNVPTYSSHTPVLRFSWVDGVTIRGNTQPAKFEAVATTNCTQVSILGNFFSL